MRFSRSRTIAVVLAACLSAALGEWIDHPAFKYDNSDNKPGPLVPVEYPMLAGRGRRLGTANDKSLEAMYADRTYDAELGSLRIQYDYSLLETDTEMCRTPTDPNAAAQTVTPGRVEGLASAYHKTYTCEAADYYNPQWKTIMEGHANWMVPFLNLTVYRLQTPLEVYVGDTPPSGPDYTNQLDQYNWGPQPGGGTVPGKLTYQNTDLVIYMIMHKCPTGVAGYAKCIFHDATTGRCLAGYFNWCPNQISVSDANSPDVKQEDRYLFLHETMHVLGCCKPSYFKKADGTPYKLSSTNFDTTSSWDASTLTNVKVYDDAAPGKTVVYVSTPKVKKVAQVQFGCDTIKGIELEDHALGSGAHWEARIMGGEVMAYGLQTGEPYLSDATLAYLEDSGHYIVPRTYHGTCGRYVAGCTTVTANYSYSVGGRFMQSTAVDVEKSWTAEFFSDGDTTDESAKLTRSPGYMRWGRHQGCNFFIKSAKSWSDRYLCKSNAAAGCTPDNRMSARCKITKWGPGLKVPSDPNSCISTAAENCKFTNSFTNSPNVPEIYNYLGGTCTTAECTAGYSDSFDYVPVKLGYWNCLDEKPSSTSTTRNNNANVTLEDSSSSGGFSSLANDLEKFGGQWYGTQARCFESTLREVGNIKSLEYAAYGLCYLSNCFKSDYLQIGVRSRGSGTDWYGCPKGGDWLYLPGFTGSVYCPNATEFCVYEDISGEYYGETNLLYAWLFFAFVCGVPLLLAFYCCCFPKHAKPCVLRVKLCCGIELARDERVEVSRRLAQKRVEKSNRLMKTIYRAEERFLERGGSTLHYQSANEIGMSHPNAMSDKDKAWAEKQVHHDRTNNKYSLVRRIADLPIAAEFRDRTFDTPEPVMHMALTIRERDPRVAGLAGAATVVFAKLTSNDEKLLEHYAEVELRDKLDGRAAWFLHGINTIWVMFAMVLLFMAVGVAFDFGVWSGSDNAAPFLYGIALIILIISCTGSVGSSELRPSLTLLAYFYVCVFSIIYVILATCAFFIFRDQVEDKIDDNWYSYRMYFPNSYHDLDRDEAVDKFDDDTKGYGTFGIIAFGVWILFSLVAGAWCSVIILTWDSIVLNVFIFANIFLLSLATVSLVVSAKALTADVLILLPATCVGASCLLIFLAIFGIYNDMHLSFRTVSTHVSFHRRLFDLYIYICVPLALVFIAGGVATVVMKGSHEDEIDDLSDEEISDLADALGESGTRQQLKDYLVSVMMFMGVIMVAEGVTLAFELPLMWYMDRLHRAREEKLLEYEKDAEYARKEGVLKYLPAPGLSIIPQLKPYRDKIRHARQKEEQREAKRATTPAVEMTERTTKNSTASGYSTPSGGPYAPPSEPAPAYSAGTQAPMGPPPGEPPMHSAVIATPMGSAADIHSV